MNPPRPITITDSTIIRAMLFVALAVLLWYVREVLAAVFVALVFAAAMDPTVTRLQKAGVPRGTAMVMLLVAAFAILWLIAKLAVPVIVSEGSSFVRTITDFTQRGIEVMKDSPNAQLRDAVNRVLKGSPEGITAASEQFLAGALNVFSGVLGLVGIVVLTVYGAVHQRDLLRLLLAFQPASARGETYRMFQKIRDRLGLWLRGQLLLGGIIFAMTYIGLLILGVRFALVLALIAGITEWIPIVGPLIGAVPAVLVAVSQYPLLGVWVMLLYVVIQQLENYLIVPRVMAHATGLNPLMVIVAILIGAKLAGIAGIFLAVPMAIIVTTWLETILERNARQEAEAAAASARRGDTEQALDRAQLAAEQAAAADAIGNEELLRESRAGGTSG